MSHIVLKHMQNPLPKKYDPGGPLEPLKFFVLLNEEEYGNELASMGADTAVPAFFELQRHHRNNYLYNSGHWQVQPLNTQQFPKGGLLCIEGIIGA
jgi:hypothetical protein